MATKQFIGNVRGQKGDQGVSITSVKQTTKSDIDGGINEITVYLSDGRKETFQVVNGSAGSKGDKGVSVKTVAQTTTSNADGGSNVMTVTLSDGTQSKFTVKNGNKGDKGDKGDTGDLSEECADARTSATGKSYDDLKARLDVEYNFLDTKANCIEGETSGDTITDSANAPLAYMKNSGYTEQYSTAGNNLLAYKNVYRSFTARQTFTQYSVTGNPFSKGAGKYNYSCSGDFGGAYNYGLWVYDKDNNLLLNISNIGATGRAIEITEVVANNTVRVDVVIGGLVSGTTYSGYIYPQISYGETKLPYEPFTNGASPNPNYPQEIKGLGDSGTIKVKTSNEDDTLSTQALIPISAPLYDGDYLEVYADGSGKIVRETRKLDGTGNWFADGYIGEGYRYSLPISHKGLNSPLYSTHYKQLNVSAYNAVGDYIENRESTNKISVRTTNASLSTATLFKQWLLDNDVYFLVKLAEPTTEPLTAEQVAEFMKLRTYKTTTYINADGEKVVKYVVDTKTYIDNKFAELQALTNV